MTYVKPDPIDYARPKRRTPTRWWLMALIVAAAIIVVFALATPLLQRK